MPDTQMVLKVEGVIQRGAGTSALASHDGVSTFGVTAATPTTNLSSRQTRKRKANGSSSTASTQDRLSTSSEEKRHRNIRKVVVTVKTTLQSRAVSTMEMNFKPEATSQTLSRSVIPQNDYFCQQVSVT